MSKIAHIVAVATSSLGDLGFGISAHPDDIAHVFNEGEVWIGPRQVLETNTDFVQPIPYIVIRKGDEVLAYTRGGNGGDDRLHAKVSIGFGGHVDLADAVTDADGVIDLRKTLDKACVRELQEELGIDLTFADHSKLCAWKHVISAAATPVDKVHIGFVAMVDVEHLHGIDPAGFEDVIENARWVKTDGLVTDAAAGLVTLESWTNLVLSRPFQNCA